MDTITTERPDDTPRTSRRVRADLVAGTTVIGAVVVGNLLWHLSDGSLLAAFGAH